MAHAAQPPAKPKHAPPMMSSRAVASYSSRSITHPKRRGVSGLQLIECVGEHVLLCHGELPQFLDEVCTFMAGLNQAGAQNCKYQLVDVRHIKEPKPARGLLKVEYHAKLIGNVEIQLITVKQ
jgi:hypothetical protein